METSSRHYNFRMANYQISLLANFLNYYCLVKPHDEKRQVYRTDNVTVEGTVVAWNAVRKRSVRTPFQATLI